MKTTLIGMAAVMALLIAGAWVLTSSSSAHAAPGNGATVINDTQCSTWLGYTSCFTQKAEYNTTFTEAGNMNVEGNVKFSLTITDPAHNVLTTGAGMFHYHSLVKDGVLQEQGNHVHQVFSSGSSTCTFDGDFHYANGSIQYSNMGWVCV